MWQPVRTLRRPLPLLLPPLLPRRRSALEEQHDGEEHSQDLYLSHGNILPDPPQPTRRPPRCQGRCTSRIHLTATSAHLEEQFRIVSDYAVDPLPDAPLHPLLLVDRPRVDVALGLPSRFKEQPAGEADERLLEDVEADVGFPEKPGSVQERPSDEGRRKSGEILLAEFDVRRLHGQKEIETMVSEDLSWNRAGVALPNCYSRSSIQLLFCPSTA